MSRSLFVSCVVLSCLRAGIASEAVECPAGPDGTCKGSEALDNEVLLQAKARVDDDEASQMTEDEQATENDDDDEGSALEVEDFDVAEGSPLTCEEMTKSLSKHGGRSDSQNKWYGPAWGTARPGRYKVTLTKINGQIGAYGTGNNWAMQVRKNGAWVDANRNPYYANGRSSITKPEGPYHSKTQYYESSDAISGIKLKIPTWNTNARFKLKVCYQALIYQITHSVSNKCLEARGNGQGQGVKMENCDKFQSLQNWGFTNTGIGAGKQYGGISSWNGMITMNNGQYCLDASERDKNNGRVHLWGCNTGNQNQEWTKGRWPCQHYCADTMFKSTHGKCLRSKSNGNSKVVMWSCDRLSDDQHWTVLRRR